MLRNVILVKPRSYIRTLTPPLGIGYLLKALEGIDGINRVFIDQHLSNMEEKTFLEKIEAMQPLIIGFQIFSVNYADFCRVVPKVRKVCPEAKIIAGGPHISGLPEQTLIDIPDLDFVVRGEGEETLRLLTLGLLQGTLDGIIESIPNLVYRTGNRIIMNESKWIDVNKYGAPDWKILEPDRYPPIQHGTYHKSKRVVPIITSRGCPYLCTFCAGHLVTGRGIRRRDINNIVDEIEFLQSSYGFEEFIIEDENFTFYKDHVINLSKELKNRNINCYFSFPNGIRLDKIDEEIAYHLRRMGTYMVSFGIESGSERILKAMKKNWDLSKIKDKVHLLRKNKIIVNASFILGFSGETMEDIKKTVDFAIKSGIYTAYFLNYIPLPGSEDFNRLLSIGELKLDGINWDSYSAYAYSGSGILPYHPRNISEEDLLRATRYAFIRFYFRPIIILNMLKRMTNILFCRNLISAIINLFKPKRN